MGACGRTMAAALIATSLLASSALLSLSGCFQCSRASDAADVGAADANAARTDDGIASVSICGNGQLEESEACDDGNLLSGDGCASDCALEVTPTCGDGLAEAGEECDDGNVSSYDGCSASCRSEFLGPCGDGVVNAGEKCDATPGCSPDCINACAEPACNEPILAVGCADALPRAINLCVSFDGDGAAWAVVWNQAASAVQGVSLNGSVQLALGAVLAAPLTDVTSLSVHGALATDLLLAGVDATSNTFGWRVVPSSTLDASATWTTGPVTVLASGIVPSPDGEYWMFAEHSDRSYHLHALLANIDLLIPGLGPDPLDADEAWSSRQALDIDSSGRIVLAWFDYSAGMRRLRVETRDPMGNVLPVDGATATDPYAFDSYVPLDLRYVRLFWLADGGFGVGFIVTEYGAIYGAFFDAATVFTLGFATGAKGMVPSLEWDVASREDGTVIFAILSMEEGCRRVRMMVDDATPTTLSARATAFGPALFVVSGTNCSARTPVVDVNSTGDVVVSWLDDAPRPCGLQVYSRFLPALL